MVGAAIAPTVTHKVRAFFTQQGIELKPWSGLQETYDRLYVLLDEKKHDPEFWPPLAELLEAIVDGATNPEAGCLPTPQAELLRSWDIENLVEEMRSILAHQRPARFKTFVQRASVSALGGFLLFGLVATGCSSSATVRIDGGAGQDTIADSEPDVDGAREDIASDLPVDAEATPPWAEDCELDRTSTLFRTLAASELGDGPKRRLCTCLTTLNASWNEGLTELFQTGTPEQIAAALHEMMECCSFGSLNSDFSQVRGAFLNGTLCSMPMPYRGVSFPELSPTGND